MTFKEFRREQRITDKMFEDMSEAEKGELFGEFQTKSISDLEKKIEKLDKSTDLEEVKAQLKELKENKGSVSATEFEEVKQEIVSAMEQIKALKESGVPSKDTQKGSLKAALEANKEKITALKDGSFKGQIKFEYKAVATITTGNVTPTTAGGVVNMLTDFEPGVLRFARTAPFFAALFPSYPTNSKTVGYAEMVTPEGGAAMTAEGALKSQADFNLEEKTTDVKKVTAFIKTSTEALDDIEGLMGEIENELITLVDLKADSQVLNGDGTGQNLRGVLEDAQPFAAGDFANTIVAPNEYDVLSVAINQIEVAEVISGEPAGFMPNVIVLHPTDVRRMRLTKDLDNNYVFPIYAADGTRVEDLPVIANARMTKGDFLVMDSSKGTVRPRQATTVELGYEMDDFTKNLVTIRAEKRLAFYIKSQNVKAFVTGTFATAKAELGVA